MASAPDTIAVVGPQTTLSLNYLNYNVTASPTDLSIPFVSRNTLSEQYICGRSQGGTPRQDQSLPFAEILDSVG